MGSSLLDVESDEEAITTAQVRAALIPTTMTPSPAETTTNTISALPSPALPPLAHALNALHLLPLNYHHHPRPSFYLRPTGFHVPPTMRFIRVHTIPHIRTPGPSSPTATPHTPYIPHYPPLPLFRWNAFLDRLLPSPPVLSSPAVPDSLPQAPLPAPLSPRLRLVTHNDNTEDACSNFSEWDIESDGDEVQEHQYTLEREALQDNRLLFSRARRSERRQCGDSEQNGLGGIWGGWG